MQEDRPRRTAGLIIAGGLVAGAIDITYACTYWALKAGAAPTRILQSVAAGLLGPAAFQGGPGTAALGLALHFGIALTIAVVYYVASRHHDALVKRPVAYGLAYGVMVYAVMNAIVVPLSAARPGAPDRFWILLSLLVHAVGIGVPCAVAASRALRDRRRTLK